MRSHGLKIGGRPFNARISSIPESTMAAWFIAFDLVTNRARTSSAASQWPTSSPIQAREHSAIVADESCAAQAANRQGRENGLSPVAFAPGGLGAVLAEGARARAHLGEEVHQRPGERVLLETIVHVLAALLAPDQAGALEHRQMLGDGRLRHRVGEALSDLARG